MAPPPPASVAMSSMPDEMAPPLAALPAVVEEARLRRQAFFAVMLAAACIGFSPVFVRMADVGPAAIGFWRLFFALGPTAFWAYAEQRAARQRAQRAAMAGGHPVQPFRSFTPRQFLLAIGAGLFFGADLVLFHAGLAHTTTANGILLGNLAVVFIFVLGWLCLGEKPSRGLFVALVLALAGTGIIITRSAAGSDAATGTTLVAASAAGDLLCVAAAACYAGFMLFVRILRRQDVASGAPSMGGGMVALLSSLSGMVFCLAWAIGAGELLLPQSLKGLLVLVGLGVVAHAAGQGLTTFALGRLPVGLTSVVQLLQIVFGVSLAALFFGEIPPLAVVFGGSLVVAGVLTARPRS